MNANIFKKYKIDNAKYLNIRYRNYTQILKMLIDVFLSKRNELITVDVLFQETDTFEIKKLGLIVPRKVLEHKGFEIGQKFKIDFNGGKKITLAMTT